MYIWYVCSNPMSVSGSQISICFTLWPAAFELLTIWNKFLSFSSAQITLNTIWGQEYSMYVLRILTYYQILLHFIFHYCHWLVSICCGKPDTLYLARILIFIPLQLPWHSHKSRPLVSPGSLPHSSASEPPRSTSGYVHVTLRAQSRLRACHHTSPHESSVTRLLGLSAFHIHQYTPPALSSAPDGLTPSFCVHLAWLYPQRLPASDPQA